MDPKVRNLIIWIVQSLAMIGLGGYLWLKYVSSEPFQALGQLVVLIAIWRSLLTFYRRCIIPPKHPRQYGKWAVVTGCTDGIGKAYVDYLAEEGMNILLISRSEDKLKDQMKALQELHGEKDADGVARFKYMAYDFTTTGSDCDAFFAKIEAVFEDFGKIGSLGVLINNVGITNAHPMKLEEFDDGFVQDILTVNVLSTIRMSRLAHRVMLAKGNGAVISVSSGSGNHPTPQLAVYSSTKALITQFSRSMHVECWDTGVRLFGTLTSSLCASRSSRHLFLTRLSLLSISSLLFTFFFTHDMNRWTSLS